MLANLLAASVFYLRINRFNRGFGCALGSTDGSASRSDFGKEILFRKIVKMR